MQPLTHFDQSGVLMAPPRVVDRPCLSSEVLLPYIARRLGIVHQLPRTIVKKVRLLADKAGFPLPKTPRFVGAVRMTGANAIDARSVWDRDAVDLWFEGDRPRAETQGMALARQSAARAEMAKRGLQLLQGGRA